MDVRTTACLGAMALIPTLIACEAQLECELCGGGHATEAHVDRSASESGATPDPDAVLADDVLLAFVERHRADGFVRVNAQPYASDVSDKNLNVFVSEFALPEYLETMPDEARSDGMIPRGSFVVRELVDEAGEVTRLTALYRGPKGYNPESGDFWFAVTDPDGRVLRDEDDTPMAGPLEGCSSCHAARASADYLFGVPGQARFPEFGHPSRTPEEPPAPEEDDPSPESAANPAPTPPKFDLTGWTLANVQRDLSREQTATFDELVVAPPSNVVIARDATREQFESYWGLLPDSTVFVNQAQTSSFGAPIVNGDETWELRDGDGLIIDGPTPVGRSEAVYRRQSERATDWLEFAVADATPGVVQVSLPAGVWLTEWADADDFRMEFVEIAVRGE